MHRLLVWMPYHLWKVRLSCPQCKGQLTGAGIHKRARKVLDVDRYYLMVKETLRCNSSSCITNYLSTIQTVLDQLSLALSGEFRIILTCK
jgi:pantothenate kinase type III